MTASPILRLCFALPALIALNLPRIAYADAKVGDRFGDWVFECAALAEGKTDCALSQTIVSQKDNRRIVKFNLARNRQTSGITLTALLPLGIHLPSGVSGVVDQGKPFQFALQTCIQQGCIATYPVDAGFLKNLQAGQKLGLNFSVNGGKRPVSINGSLNGLVDGLKAANLN